MFILIDKYDKYVVEYKLYNVQSIYILKNDCFKIDCVKPMVWRKQRNIYFMNSVLNILIVSLILHIVFTACPNSCSGHGICSTNNVCRCYPGYSEGDCSLSI